jgi:hypothetical protein
VDSIATESTPQAFSQSVCVQPYLIDSSGVIG